MSRRDATIQGIRDVAHRLGIAPGAVSRIAYNRERLGVGAPAMKFSAVGSFSAMRDEAAGKPPTLTPKKRTEPATDPVELSRMRARLRASEDDRARLVERLSAAEARADLLRAVQDHSGDEGAVWRRERTSGLREATAVALASDWHVEETVDPATVEGRNEYTPEIAESRARRFAEGITWLLGHHQSSFRIRDLVLWLGGDLITGYIHPELAETNAMAPPPALLFAMRLVRQTIDHILEHAPEIETIHVPCNHGNHGRITEKRRVSNGAAMSFEHMAYCLLAEQYRDNPRVRFQVARGSHTYLDVYDITARFHHGDDVRYHGGVGGVYIPLHKALAAWDTFRRADLTYIGHFHQLLDVSRFAVNGSLIGYGPYALSIKAPFERPQQAFHLIDSRRGKCMLAPIWVDQSPHV